MKKLSKKEYSEFWNNIHHQTGDDLASVCFPDKPLYFNLFFDRIQKYVISQYLKREHVSLSDKKLLDIGCGRGRWLSFFRDNHGTQVTGIDLSATAVKTCTEKGFNAVAGTVVQMPFADSYFDFVNSTTVLLHLPYDIKEQAISEIARVLKAGGKALLIESTWDDPSAHVYGLSISTWEKMFSKYNMRLVYNAGHCFNFFRRKLPASMPFRDFLSIYLDYPLEYLLMRIYYAKQSNIALQHLMVFEK